MRNFLANSALPLLNKNSKFQSVTESLSERCIQERGYGPRLLNPQLTLTQPSHPSMVGAVSKAKNET